MKWWRVEWISKGSLHEEAKSMLASEIFSQKHSKEKNNLETLHVRTER